MPSDALARLAGANQQQQPSGGGSDALRRLTGGSVPEQVQAAPEPAPDTSEQGADFSPAGLLGAAGLAAGGAYMAAKNPSKIKTALRGANALRMQLMLSGFALPKSILGNVGATVAESAERGSLEPLKQLLSRKTLSKAKEAYATGGHVGPTPGVTLPGPNPGKAMGALDVATRDALERSGMTAEGAEQAVFQTPLSGKRMGQLGNVLESEAAGYILPFRRTPFNQFLEGLDILKTRQHPKVLAGYTAAGAAHGAATSDERYPVTVPLAVAGSAKYGLPYALSALAGRALAGGSGGGGIASNVLPVSEYGVEQSVTKPLKPFTDPAILRALEKLSK